MFDLAELPLELLDQIVAILEREDLKSVRLTSHVFSTLATNKLFKEVHITPNSYSFDRAHSVAACDHLNKHVRSLMYHFGKLGEFYAGFEAFKREYWAVRRTGVHHDPYEITPEVLWSYNCWLEEIDAQRTFELRDEAEELRSLCNNLPRLEAIGTLHDAANPFGDQKDYIGKRTGMAASEDDGQWRLRRLLTAAVDKPLQKMSARSIQWCNLRFMDDGSDREIQAVHQCLGRLKYLELAIYTWYEDHDDDEDYNGNPDREGYPHHIDRLDAVLKHAPQLEILKLDFDELPYESEAETAFPISRTIFRHHWPQLRELKLEAICVQEDEICDFLRSHSTSLKKLWIGDIELFTPGKPDFQSASHSHSYPKQSSSILNVFFRLHQFLHLRSCRITGNFTNRINQAWYVNTEFERPGCLRDQLEKFVCGIESPAVDLCSGDVTDHWRSGRYLPLWLPSLQSNYQHFSDESWQWAPELLPQD